MCMKRLFGLALMMMLLFALGSTWPYGAQTGRSYVGYGNGNQLQAEPPRQSDGGHRHGHGCGHALNEHHHHNNHLHHHQQQPHEQHAGFNPSSQPQFYPRNTPQGSVLHQPPSSQTFTPGYQQSHDHLPGSSSSAESHAQHPGYGVNTGLPHLDGNAYNSNANSLTPSTQYGHRFQPTRPQSQPAAPAGTEVTTGFQYANPGVPQGTSTSNAQTPTIFEQNLSEIFNTRASASLPTSGGHSPSHPKGQTEEVMPDSINDRGLFDTPPKCADDEKAVNGHCRKMV